jgi:hypothetical protein
MNCGNTSLLTNYIDFNFDLTEYRSAYHNYAYIKQINVENGLFLKKMYKAMYSLLYLNMCTSLL